MICSELSLICAACRERHVNVVDRGEEIVVYADLMKELFNTTVKRVVEVHVAKCAEELAAAVVGVAERHGWREVGGKMRFFYVVKKA
jgi:hypothetical protein